VKATTRIQEGKEKVHLRHKRHEHALNNRGEESGGKVEKEERGWGGETIPRTFLFTVKKKKRQS